ncbi:MAG TPA: hypothetical protein VFF20_06350 [Pseudogracilibacillus sp.]|nr:hypothetical protein [Pseudogracilibacillus sp.]
MGLKSIEMQVAIPRSQDAGKMQEQLSRQGQQFQETLTQQQLREDLIKRQRTNRQEKVLKRDVDEDEEQAKKREQEAQEAKKQMEKQELSQAIKHPYLGSKIDWTG